MNVPARANSWGATRVYIALIIALLSGACIGPVQGTHSPSGRAVTLEIGGCGDASSTVGSGVLFDDGVVVTAAHLVVQGDGIDVSFEDGTTASGTVLALDLHKDLAWVSVGRTGVGRAAVIGSSVGDTGEVVGGATSGTVPYVVVQVADLSIEEVLGGPRTSRAGYELHAATAGGDSGAGVYGPQGRLVGMVFAISSEGGSTWVTASREIVAFVEGSDPDTAPHECDPASSKIQRSS